MLTSKNIVKNFKGVIDSTLREGLQFHSANIPAEKQQYIFKLLSNIGVDYIEVGNPMNKEVKRTIQSLFPYKLQSKILAHVRNRSTDIQEALDIKVDGVNILFTIDDERINSMRLTFQDYLNNLRSNIQLAQQNNLEVRVSVEDFFNRSLTKAVEVFTVADNYHIHRIGLAETLGKAMNWEIYKRIRTIRQLFSVDIEVHLHNDLGHATSNALWALKAGANWVDTTLLGIGERTGITPLSSFLANLLVIDPQLTKRYNLELLTAAENYLAQLCNVHVPFNLLTNQANGFAHKAGIHLDALIKHGPHKYEIFQPRVFGNKRRLIHSSLISGKTTAEKVKQFYKLYGEQ